MLNAKAFANAVTFVTGVFYVVCLFLSIIAPDFILGIAKAWIHTINLEGLKSTAAITFESAILGFVSIILITWITTYATIFLYNKWAKK